MVAVGEEKLITNPKLLLPWRWAESMRSCSLFWIPAKLASMPRGQHEWLLEFFTQLTNRLSESDDLHAEHFMQMQVIDGDQQLRKVFLNAMMRESPLLGRTWSPRARQPIPATQTEVDLLAAGKKEFHPYDYAPHQAWWFMSRDEAGLRKRYLGYGGLTVFLVKPSQDEDMPPPPAVPDVPMIIPKFMRRDPGIKMLLEDFDPKSSGRMPQFLRNHRGMKPVFSNFDVDGQEQRTKSLMSPFRDLSKEVFGASMPRDLEFESIPFLVPRLASQDFFAQTEQQIRRWFDVFSVYINESPEDDGVIMACKDNLTPLIAAIVDQMRGKGYRYWEG
jgi:hypothetical protein